MKLDKVEITQKKKHKKAIVIGVSTVAVVTFCGITGWGLLRNEKSDVIKFAQSVISGQGMRKVLAEEENATDGQLSEATVKSLENYMAKTGFGYNSAGNYKISEEDLSAGDKKGENTQVEKLYMMCNQDKNYSYYDLTVHRNVEGNVKNKPKYAEDPGELPEIKGEKTGEDYHTNSGWIEYTFSYTYKGSHESVTIRKNYSAYAPTEEDFKKEEDYIKFEKEFEVYKQEWQNEKQDYYKWTGWKLERNKWISEKVNKGFFETQNADTTYDDYTEFWAKVARLTLGLSNKFDEDLTGEAIDGLVNLLYGQIFDENGEERANVANLLEKGVNGDDLSLYPAGDPNNSNTGGNGSGSTGNTTGGNTTGGNTTGGNTTGGNTTGGNTTEPPVDKVAPSIEKVSIASPTTGSYSKGQEIRIKVDFDKNVYGAANKVEMNQTTAPKLLIKFGDEGENKLATFDFVSGKSIVYTYLIEETDNGQLQIGTGDNYIGTVYNESGYKADLKSIEKFETDRQIEADNIGPVVEKIETISDEGEYKTGSEIQIKVTFNEAIYTAKNKIPMIKSAAPILNISFGEGEVKHLEVSEINDSENCLIYKYTITSEDRGTLKVDGANAFDGTKNVCDQLGNEVTLIAGKDLEGNEITANSDLAQISLDKKEITLDLNGTKTAIITATVTPEGTALTWESSDSSVATIDEKTGTVTALAIGETDITVKTEDGAIATCKVTVKDTTNGVTKVELNKTSLELDLNGTKTDSLVATVTPNELEVTWSSTDENIVTVDNTGTVTAITKGEAEIIAKAKDGTTATCQVKVVNTNADEIEPTSIELNVQNVKVILGKVETIELKATVRPSNSNKNTKITYESSDDNIASVDSEGKVSIKAKGTAVITATTENGQKAYCAIEVVEVTADSELNSKMLGDINEDEKVDTTDLLSMLRHIASTSSSEIAEKHQDWMIINDKYIIADVNGNGIIDVTDSLKIQRHMAASKNETIKSNYPDWIIETNWE